MRRSAPGSSWSTRGSAAAATVPSSPADLRRFPTSLVDGAPVFELPADEPHLDDDDAQSWRPQFREYDDDAQSWRQS